MELAPSGAGGITRGPSGGPRGPGGRRAENPTVFRSLVEFSKSLYTDQYRWAIVKGGLFFAAGVFVARELAQVDFDEVVMSPPPS